MRVTPLLNGGRREASGPVTSADVEWPAGRRRRVEPQGPCLRMLEQSGRRVSRFAPRDSLGDGVQHVASKTTVASTFLLALWLEGRHGRWELTERGDRDGVMRWWTKLPLDPEPERLEEAKTSAEAIIGPCVWLDRGSLSVGPWTVVSTVGRPVAAAR